jgi:hypothetical protein
MPAETGEIQALRRLLEEQLKREERAELRAEVVDVPQRIQELKSCYREFHRSAQFKPGDLVRWKRPLKNKKRPRYDEPAIVIEVLAKPKTDPEKETGSTYFGEPLDVVLGLIDEDGDFVVYHYDHRRFELWEADARAKAARPHSGAK